MNRKNRKTIKWHNRLRITEETVTKIVIENDTYVYRMQYVNRNLKKKFISNCVSNVPLRFVFFYPIQILQESTVQDEIHGYFRVGAIIV